VSEGWFLTFEDQFDGTELNLDNWRHQTGVGRLDPYTGGNYGLTGWGNEELQFYHSSNTTIVHEGDGSFMRINARRQNRGEGGLSAGANRRDFTSSRIRSAGNFAQQWGRFEARIRMDAVQGFWPAFWLMPEPPVNLWRTNCLCCAGSVRCVSGVTQGTYGGWPRSGEIDVMELVGIRTTSTTSAQHYGMGTGASHVYDHSSVNFNQTGSERGGDTFEGWQVYGVDWWPDRIEYWVNGVVFFVVHARGRTFVQNNPSIPIPGSPDLVLRSGLNRTSVVNSRGWIAHGTTNNFAIGRPGASANAPFDQPFHMILNLALDSGRFGGAANTLNQTTFQSGNMDVDWVRVWQRVEHVPLLNS
jgi:beta-glucanase (GH16 family)